MESLSTCEPSFYCNESGDYAIDESDEHGFNNPAGIWRQKPKVVLIGDSFTQGACVGPGEDVAGQLRKMGINAINLERSAYRTGYDERVCRISQA